MQQKLQSILSHMAKSGITRLITPDSEGDPIPADFAFHADRHPGREILFCLDGTCPYPLNGRLFHLMPGDAVLIPPWSVHEYGYEKNVRDILHIWYLPDMGRASAYGVDKNGIAHSAIKTFSIPAYVQELLLSRWKALERSGMTDADPAKEYLKSAVNVLLEEMLLIPAQEAHGGDSGQMIVDKVLAAIHRTHGRDCSLENLAAQTGCSKFYLAHLVRERTGRSIGAHIDDARRQYVLSAQEYGLMQKEIAWNLGFSSPAAFWNWQNKKRK